MTQDQMNWAAQHDWFVASWPCGRVMVRDCSGYRTFTDFRAMRDWAGY